jgi:cation transport regulator ChaB
MAEMFPIQDSQGFVRRDFSELEIATLAPEHQEIFFELLAAANEERDAEQEAKDADQNVTACNRALANAEEAHHKAIAPRTFLEELRAVQNRPKY